LERDLDALLEQLELNQTFFIELGLFTVLYFILSRLYFKPFLVLFQNRHKRTVEDREAAERILAQANAKLDEYKAILAQEKQAVKKEYDLALNEAKKAEFILLTEARNEAKKITQEAMESMERQKSEIKRLLEKDVDTLAQSISERLLSRNA
jgi:F-type H+-transporting ATPase subunit b